MIYVLCFVVSCFQIFGSRPKFGKFVEMAISNYQWQRMHDRYVFLCFVAISIADNRIISICLFFNKTHFASQIFFRSQRLLPSLHAKIPPKQDRPQLEALQSQTESLIQALGSIFGRFLLGGLVVDVEWGAFPVLIGYLFFGGGRVGGGGFSAELYVCRFSTL